MKTRHFVSLLVTLFSLIGCKQDMQFAQHGVLGAASPNIGLFLNGGQSNDEKGVLLVSTDLVPPYSGSFPQVLYYGDDGVLRPLDSSDQDAYQAPVNGVTDNYANQFYLYNRLRLAMGVDILIVCSYSVGDTDLANDWISNGTGTLYNSMVSRINTCKSLIASTYNTLPRAVFFLWDQGEKDGRLSLTANAYFTNFTNFVADLRTDINEPNMKFLCPLINQMSINASPNPVSLGYTVNAAKVAVKAAESDPNNIVLVDTNDCEPSTDGVHFTATGQFDKNTFELQAAIDAGWVAGTHSPTVPTDQTVFNGYSAACRFGDILDASFFATTNPWRVGVTVYKPARYGSRTLVSKFDNTGANREWHWLYTGTSTIAFNYYMTVGNGTVVRGITWTMPATMHDGNEHTLEIRYDGSVNTNAGLDRADFYYDGALYTTGKTLAVNTGTLGTIFNSTAQLAVGALVTNAGTRVSTNFFYSGYMRNFFIQNGSGTDQIRVANLLTGTDSSGNGNNGTYAAL